MPTLRERKKRQTRKAILDAAVELFSSRGFEQTSIEQLARKAGVGKGTVYGYFATKQEIFLAFCEEELDYVFARLDREVDPEAPLLDQILALSMAQFDFVTANREFGRIFCSELFFPREQLSAKSRELDARYLGRVMQILKKAQQRGELRAETDPLLALAAFHSFYLMVLSGWYGGYFTDRDQVAAMLRALCHQSLIGWGSADPGPPPDEAIMAAIRAPIAELNPALLDLGEEPS